MDIQIVMIALGGVFLFCLVIASYLAIDLSIKKLKVWVGNRPKVKRGLRTLSNGVFSVVGFIGITVVGLFFLYIIMNFAATYKSPHERRLEFLKTNCDLVDEGYEILNDGKSTYKCPNGNQYRE